MFRLTKDIKDQESIDLMLEHEKKYLEYVYENSRSYCVAAKEYLEFEAKSDRQSLFCIYGSRLKSLSISDKAIIVEFLCPYMSKVIKFTYLDVYDFSISISDGTDSIELKNDELRVDGECMVHELEILGLDYWNIRCREFEYSYTDV